MYAEIKIIYIDFFLMSACMQVEVHVCTCACVYTRLHVHGEPAHVCMCV